MAMDIDVATAAVAGAGLAAAAGLVRADRAVRSADGPRRALRRLRGHGGHRGALACCRLVGAGRCGWRIIRWRPPAHGGHAAAPPSSRSPATGTSLGEFGSLRLTIGYYIDALTLAMFCMVTLVASCIHVYSFGYMHGELHEVTDPLAPLADGQPVRRRGRFCRFFQYLSLFCFSMLGLVIAGNVAMVFVFWELVGICSYLLIGF